MQPRYFFYFMLLLLVVLVSTTASASIPASFPTATQNFRVYTRWVAQSTNATNASYTIAPNTAGSTPTNIQNDTFLVYADQQGTPRLIKNYANQTRWYWYPELAEAFGANVPNENPSALGTFTYNLRFPGQIYDPTSQLSYNGNRMYNPRTDRYLTSDPIGLAGGQMSTYSYANANPLTYIDPDGRLLFLPIIAALAEGGTGAWAGAGALGLGGAVWWGSQNQPKPSAGNNSSDSPFANSGADSGSNSSSSSSNSSSSSIPSNSHDDCGCWKILERRNNWHEGDFVYYEYLKCLRNCKKGCK